MKKILIILSFLISAIGLEAQTGNLITGDGSAENLRNSSEYNTIFGDSVLVNGTYPDYLTILGYQAGYNNTSAYDNTLLGYQAGYSATTGTDNLMIGYQAGYSNTNTDNTMIGYQAGYHNTSGRDNTFIGFSAAEYASDGDDNICIGSYAGHYLHGDDNIFIGSSAGDGNANSSGANGNTALGTEYLDGYDFYFGPLIRLKGGTFNTALGLEAGRTLEGGDYNTLLGIFSGQRLVNHQGNTFVGYESGQYIKGDKNVVVGTEAGDSYHTGDNVVYAGYGADGFGTQKNTVCLGAGARAEYDGLAIGFSTLVKKAFSVGLGYDGHSNSDGSIGMGYQFNVAGGNFSIGIGDQVDIGDSYAVGIGTNVNIDNTDAIAIGDNADANGNYSIAYGPSASVSGNNSVALGNGVSVTTDHTITIGNSTVTSIRGTVNWTTLSDGRYKTAVKEDVPGLAFIDALRPVSYELNSQPGIRYSGFIAQEVEAAAEALGYDFSGVKKAQNEQDHYGLRYAAFVVPLTKAVQELDEEYKKNETQITQNKAKLQHYASAIAQLKAKVAQLQQTKAASNTTVSVD